MTARRRTARAALVGAVLLGSLLPVGGGEPPSGWQQVHDMYERADLALVDVPLDQMVEDADLTVVGRFGEVVGERELRPDYLYVQIELHVTEVIAGDVAAGDVLTFEGWTRETPTVPEGEMLLFLDEKVSDVDPPGVWIWHTSRGIWVQTWRADVDTPIAGEPPTDHPLYRDDLDGVATLDDLIALVREMPDPS